MNWQLVIDTLRQNAELDMRRAQDCWVIHRDTTGAIQLRTAAIVSNRLAEAFQAGLDSSNGIEPEKKRKTRGAYTRGPDLTPRKKRGANTVQGQ